MSTVAEAAPVQKPGRVWRKWRIVAGCHVGVNKAGEEIFVRANQGMRSIFESDLPLDKMHNQPGSIKFECLEGYTSKELTARELRQMLAEAEKREAEGAPRQQHDGDLLEPKGTGPNGEITEEDHARHMELLAEREMNG